jgi:hypothetical protein
MTTDPDKNKPYQKDLLKSIISNVFSLIYLFYTLLGIISK